MPLPKLSLSLLAVPLFVAAALAGVNEELREAVNGKDLEGVRAALAQGVDVNAKVERGGASVLLRATYDGDAAIVHALLDAGADVNLPDDAYGGTALMYAAEGGHPGIVRLLIRAGANINAKSKAGWTARQIAAKLNKADVLSALNAGTMNDAGVSLSEVVGQVRVAESTTPAVQAQEPPRSGITASQSTQLLKKAAGAGNAAGGSVQSYPWDEFVPWDVFVGWAMPVGESAYGGGQEAQEGVQGGSNTSYTFTTSNDEFGITGGLGYKLTSEWEMALRANYLRRTVTYFSPSYGNTSGLADYVGVGITPQWEAWLGKHLKAYLFLGPGFNYQQLSNGLNFIPPGPMWAVDYLAGGGLKLGWAGYPYIFAEFLRQQNIGSVNLTYVGSNNAGSVSGVGFFSLGVGFPFGENGAGGISWGERSPSADKLPWQ